MLYLRAFGLRAILTVLAITLLCFLLIDQPILREIYHLARQLGEFGRNVPAAWRDEAPTVIAAYLRSMTLLVSSLLLAAVLGLGLGLLAGSRAQAPMSRLLSGVSHVGLVVPSFLLALAIMVFFVRYLGHWTGTQLILLRPTPELSLDPRYIIAPALTLAARPVAHITHVTATMLREQLSQDYIRTALGKGLTQGRILRAHAWPNIAVSVLEAVNGSLLFSLSSLPIVEFVFSWPGIGLYLLAAVLERDTERVLFLLLSVSLTFLLLNLGSDLLARALEPQRDQATG